MTQLPLWTVSSNVDVGENAYYAFPAGTVYMALEAKDSNGTVRKKLLIDYYGSATFATSNYNNAPLGSLLQDNTAGAVKLYIKTAATTWTVVGAQS